MQLELEWIAAELARELPAHVRAVAAAYAAGTPAPPAPEIASLPSTRRAVLRARDSELARALARVVLPLAIEDDPRVAAARATERTWEHYTRLATARDAVATALAGSSCVALMHRLFQVPASSHLATAILPPRLEAWHQPSPARGSLCEIWRALAAQHAVAAGGCTIVEAAAHARMFFVEPGEVIVVVPPPESPAARFAALHELGHAVAALLAREPLPRTRDEAAAALVARSLEDPAHPWYEPHALAARGRRRALAEALAAIEWGVAPPPALARPPWALWNDPGAQAAYVAAEDLAERYSTSGAAGVAALVLGSAPSGNVT